MDDQEEEMENQEQNNGGAGLPLSGVASDLQGIADKAKGLESKMTSKAGKMREKAAGKRQLATIQGGPKAAMLNRRAGNLENKARKLEEKTKKVRKIAQKAEKFSKLAMKLGKLIALAGVVILIILVVIGLLVFILTGWGMLLSGFKQIAQGFFDQCQSILSGAETVVHGEDIVTALGNIEQMGYDLYGYGFITAKDESSKEENGNYKFYNKAETTEEGTTGENSLIESLEEKNAYRNITTYLISDNYAYYIKNHNFNFRAMQLDAKHFFGGIFDGTNWGSGLISIYKQDGNDNTVTGVRGEVYGSLGDKIVHGATLGTVATSYNPIFGIVGGAVEGIGSIFADWDEITSSIKVDRASKTLNISAIGLGHNQTFSYKLDGWTGRYSMPLEFLLATHIATMAPDLSYQLATSFNTDVEILLATTTGNETKGGIKLPNGTVITYDDFEKKCRTLNLGSADSAAHWVWLDKMSLTKKDAARIFKEIDGLESQIEGTYKCTGTDNTQTIFSENRNWDFNNPNEISTNIKESFSNFLNSNSEVKFVQGGQAITANNITNFLSDDILDFDSYQDIGTSNEWEDDKEGKFHYVFMNQGVIEVQWWRYKGIIEADDGEQENTSYEIKYTIHREGKGKSSVTLEINKITVSEEPAEELCSARAKSDAGLNKTCTNCRNYLRTIYGAMSSMTDREFKTFVPYINCVTDHWFRNVYFTQKALVENEGKSEAILTDTNYEARTGERWTLYEKERGTTQDELYIYIPDRNGNYTGEFYQANGRNYVICRKVEAGEGQYSFAKEGGTTYVADDNGDYKLYEIVDALSDDPNIRYSEYTNASIKEFKVGKKAITKTVSEGWTAYDGDVKVQDGGWEEVEDPTGALQDIKDLGLTPVYQAVKGGVLQSDDGVRGQTNAKIKEMFLDEYYLYDGSGSKAALIEEAKNMVKAAGAAAEDIDDPDVFKKLVEEGKIKNEIKAEYQGEKLNTTIDEISGSINLSQNSLTAFEILTNMHTLDSEYIYHDFKELVVELNYFDKEDLTEPAEEVMMFPVADISSAGWPVTRYDKSEEFYGTLLHSSEDYKASRAETLEELQELLSQEEIEEEAEEETETTTPIQPENQPQTSENILVQAAKDIFDYVEADGGYDYSQANRASSFEASKTNKFYDCSSYVSWCLQLVGIFNEGQLISSDTIKSAEQLVDYYHSGAPSTLEPGMILIYSGHVNIYAGNGMYYDGGEHHGIKYKPYNRSVLGYISIPNNKMTYNGVTGSSNGVTAEAAEFAGFEGDEAVLSPVTGEVVKYGTVERTNMELVKNGKSEAEAKEEVGFIKIRVLGNTECLPGDKAACTYFRKNEKQNGYNHFWQEYSDASITNHVLYIEGFDVSKILGSSPDSDNSVKGGNIEALSNYIQSDEGQENSHYETDYQVPVLLDETKTEELKEREEAKEKAEFTIKRNGKIYIKEGAVIGYTYEQDKANTVEKTVNITKAQAEEEAAKEEKNKKEKTKTPESNEEDAEEMVSATYKIGNYMRIIFRDRDDQVVENVEDYMEIDDGAGLNIGELDDEKFLYWLGVKLESGQLEQRGGKWYSIVKDIGDSQGKSTHMFGLTKSINQFASEMGYTGGFEREAIPLEECVDVFLALVEADKNYIKGELGEDISDNYLQAFICIRHNYGNLTNRADEYKQNHSVSETTWTTYNGDFAEVLRKRRRVEWILITEGRYCNPYTNGEFEEIEFPSETPFTDWCKEHDLIH